MVGILVPYKTQSRVFEYGFTSTGERVPPLLFAYRSDTNKFDIDNVSLSVSFGGFFCYEFSDSINAYMDVPEFDLFFTNENSECIYLVRHSTENLASKEYNVITGYKGTRRKFNHSEMVTIPKELFSKQRGLLCLCIAGIDFMETEPEYAILACVYINYTIEKEKVILSHWDGIRKF